MRVRVRHTIDKQAARLERVAVETGPALHGIVSENIDYGRDLAKALARVNAGPHGKSFHKRINSEMTGLLAGEFGPDGSPKTEFVGVGFRSGTNTDLDRAGEKVGQSAAADVRKALTRLFR